MKKSEEDSGGSYHTSRAKNKTHHPDGSRDPAKMSTHYIYILASKRNGTLYVGVTNDLIRRVYEHRNDFVEGFTRKYGVHRLVYFEQCEDFDSVLQREKRIKEWKKKWKIELIETGNPE
jgi:putative endonuclease